MKELANGQSLKLKNYNQILKSIAAITAALLATKKDDAQVIYHDINPDVTILLNDTFDIDFNNDGVFDIQLANISSAIFGKSAKLYDKSNYVFNAVNGTVSVTPFDNGADINAALQWDHSSVLDEVGFLNLGDWKNVTDKYAGIKMKVGANYHYGWVRMDVTANPLKIVAKGYAYNETPDQHIISLVDNINPSFVPSIYNMESNVYIEIPQQENNTLCSIYNILGEKIYEKKLIAGLNEINLAPMEKGVYIVQVNGNEINYSKKILVN